VLPRASEQAGFEWGSGIYLNVVDPDVAAAALRDGLARGRCARETPLVE